MNECQNSISELTKLHVFASGFATHDCVDTAEQMDLA